MNNTIGSALKDADSYKNNVSQYRKLISYINKIKTDLLEGGGKVAIERQHSKGRLTVRERISNLIDDNSVFLEIGKFAGYNMYLEFGKISCAGLVVGIGKINKKDCMIIANDATVKAGAYFEVTLKKTLRAQAIAIENNLPIVYLVDSAGVFLPLQDQVFPDENHFGKIFYNNAQISASGIPQIACVMGPCVAGGAYLPVMCDKYIIVEGSNMFLAGPALVKAAIGQDVDAESLGGANTHTSISGTADFKVKDDYEGLKLVRQLLDNINLDSNNLFNRKLEYNEPQFNSDELLGILDINNTEQYNVLEIIARIVDSSVFNEYKKDYGKTIVCGTARIGGFNVGIVANQRFVQKTELGTMQMGGVIYNDSADKASRFIMNCNQDKVPIIFLHDVNGFMVGKESEWSGIAKDGAKMVNAVSNSTVPKISIIMGGSYGAGNYAMSGRAYNPSFLFAWPSAKIGVMGAEQAAETLTSIRLSKVGKISKEKQDEIYTSIKEKYEEQSTILYGAARMWVDEVINPSDTRYVIIRSLEIVSNKSSIKKPNYGVLQV